MTVHVYHSTLTNLPKDDRVFIGLDVSLTSTGVAIIHNGELTGMRWQPKVTGPQRLLFYDDAFMRLFAPPSSDFPDGRPTPYSVAVEDYAFGAAGKAFHIGELGGVLRVRLMKAKIPYVEVSPPTLKKFATGRGVGDKIEVAKELLKRYNVDVEGNDVTDAAGLALYALASANPEFVLTKPQQEAVSKGEWFR